VGASLRPPDLIQETLVLDAGGSNFCGGPLAGDKCITGADRPELPGLGRTMTLVSPT